MLIAINGVDYNVDFLTNFDENKPTLVCLHGFTGTANTFSFLQQSIFSHNVLVIDLIGHGQTSSYVHPYRYTNDSQISDLDTIFSKLKLETIDLLGYSMGGRLALAYALSYPHKINKLILESASPGLSNKEDREKRRQSDNRLVSLLLNQGIERFVNYWESIPLFLTQKQLPITIQKKVRQERLSQEAFGLAMSLRYFGTGIQPSLWDKLDKTYPFDTYLMVGEDDKKFVTLADKMNNSMKQSTVITLEGSGHCVHLEKPTEFVEVLTKLLI